MPSFGGGGGGAKPYVSKKTPEYEEAASGGIFRRAGGRRVLKKPAPVPKATMRDREAGPFAQYYRDIDKEQQRNQQRGRFFGKTPTEEGPQYEWDLGDFGKQVTPKADLPRLRRLYGTGGLERYERRLETPQYKPKGYKAFQFQGLPEQYGKTAYERGARGIRREGAGQLELLKETIGTRRPGLLLKAGERAQRSQGEKLAGLQEGIQLEQMQQELEMQRQQAAENFRAAGFSDDQARKMADEEFQRAQAAFGAGAGKIGLESTLLERERGYQDQAINYMMDLFKTAAGFQGEAARLGESKRQGDLGFMGGLLGGLI